MHHKNRKLNAILLIIFALILSALFFFVFRHPQVDDKKIAQEMESERSKVCLVSGVKENLIDLMMDVSPDPCYTVNYKVTFTGKLKGNYFFEGSAPVRIEDADGTTVYSSHLEATSDWMTSDYVSFKFTFNSVTDFHPNIGGRMYILIERDNPSGELKDMGQIKIPIYVL